MKRFALALTIAAVGSCDAPAPPPTEPPGPAAPGAKSPDSAALAALYRATDGDNWKRNDNWLSGEDLEDWYGIATDTSGRVTSLHLPENDLNGPIPSELGDLSRLEKLSLNDARLTGGIPSEIGNLSRLTHLNLGYNSLSGPIPSELGKLIRLEGLLLCGNELSDSIPADLGGLYRLEKLHLCHNELTGPIPAGLGSLGRLKSLSLNGNLLDGAIPPELGGLDSLGRLDLSRNNLSGEVPSELGKLTELSFLFLQSTNLSGGVPPSFGNLVNLEMLSFANSHSMHGELPLTLIDLAKLEGLDAYRTNLCAPRDPGFREWMRGLGRAKVDNCVRPAYLIQAVQSSDTDSVPLVAGEDALLRVFLESKVETDGDLPKVRARFFRDGVHSYVKDIPRESGRPIPTEIDEGDLRKSVNHEIPGRVIQPGLEMVLEIDPDSTLDLDRLGIPSRIPETGRMAIEVRSVPLLDLTAIPFLWEPDPDSSIIGTIDDMADDPEGHSLLRNTRTLLPVGDIYLTAHDPVVSESNSAFTLLARTYAIWTAEGGTGYYYMGMMARPVTGASGVAYVGIPTNFSVPSNYVIGHELGHNMNLWHAPCGGTSGNDRDFPDNSAAIVNWGYDLENDSLIHPSTKDMMSYCRPRWISGYHFNRATTFRMDEELGEEARPPSVPSLLLWGGRNADGTPFLEPAFVVDAPAYTPEASGAHRLVGRDGADLVLFSLSFDMPEVADAEGEYTSFAFALPIEAGWEGLASITLSGPGGTVTLDSDTDRPSALVRDPETGQVQALLLNLHPDTRTAEDARALLSTPSRHTLRFSTGVPIVN